MYGHLCKFHWRGIVLFITPFLLLPLIIPNYERVLYDLHRNVGFNYLDVCMYIFIALTLPIHIFPTLHLLDNNCCAVTSDRFVAICIAAISGHYGKNSHFYRA